MRSLRCILALLGVLLLSPAPSRAEEPPAAAKSGDAKSESKPKKKKKKEPVKQGEVKPAEVKPAPHVIASEPELEYGPQAPPPPLVDNVLVAVPPRRWSFGRGRALVGVRIGAALPEVVSTLGPSFLVGLEVGWLLPALPVVGEGFTVTIDGAFSQPGASGSAADPRVAGGNYAWSVAQREFSLGLTVLYRAPFVMGGRLVPYLGIGPRLFLLQTAASAQSGSAATAGYSENSTRAGFGVPLGADYKIGPGRVFLEAMFLYAPFNHDTTGPSNAGAITIEAGYRMLFGLGG